jgi:hypothetical protein
MNTFALATLTLSTLCLGGAFAAIVTARHVRLRRDAEDRRELGRVLEEVDQQLARLAAAEESSATAQIVGRLAQLDERLAELVSESAESLARTRRVEEAQQREHDERVAERLAAGAGGQPVAAHAEALEDTSSSAVADTDDEPRAASPAAQDDDPELAALLAKFDDDAFSFRGAARSKSRGGTGPSALAHSHAATATLAPTRSSTDEEVPVAEEPHAAFEDVAQESALELEAELEADLEPPVAHDASGASAAVLEPVDDDTGTPPAIEAEPTAASDDVDDELELDDLVLFFHEDDQGEPNETNADDVDLFDEVQLGSNASVAPDLDSGAAANEEPQLSSDDEIASRDTPLDPAGDATTDSPAPAAPAPLAARPAPLAPAELRRSIDELRSLTERLSAPQPDRSERLRLVNELRDAIARVRR